jgi:ribosome-binding protein aMBF1 (putative translation factor)
MDARKRRRLEATSWRPGSADAFLELSPEKSAFVELRLALSAALRERRNELGLSQIELADRLGSSQSRVAKMEACDPTVTVDLLIRSLLALGATRKEIARAIGSASPRRTVRLTARGKIR